MYRPKFCAECSAKIIRLRWHFWSSRRFCSRCAPRFLKAQMTRTVVIAGAVFLLGMAAGQAARRKPSPVVIQRVQSSVPIVEAGLGNAARAVPSDRSGAGTGNPAIAATNEELYMCGARTRKGTPCTRRVHGAVRCWQHKGMQAMLPQDKLIVKDSAP